MGLESLLQRLWWGPCAVCFNSTCGRRLGLAPSFSPSRVLVSRSKSTGLPPPSGLQMVTSTTHAAVHLISSLLPLGGFCPWPTTLQERSYDEAFAITDLKGCVVAIADKDDARPENAWVLNESAWLESWPARLLCGIVPLASIVMQPRLELSTFALPHPGEEEAT